MIRQPLLHANPMVPRTRGYDYRVKPHLLFSRITQIRSVHVFEHCLELSWSYYHRLFSYYIAYKLRLATSSALDALSNCSTYIINDLFSHYGECEFLN